MKIIVFDRFQYFLNYPFYCFHCYIYSPTCQTIVTDPLFWYSGLDLVILAEEPEEEAGEPQCVGEWQADNVI